MKKNKILLSLTIASILATSQTFANSAVGAYVDNDAWNLSNIQQYNDNVTRNAATINIFASFNADWSTLSYQANNIVSSNATPLITWLPSTNKDIGNENILQEITEGKWDSYIDKWILGFKDWRNTYDVDNQPKIMLRFAHEFNGTWYNWGNKPEQLKAAWVYLHDKFEDAKINDAVSWVWCASAVDVDDYNDISAYYPGDDVVDWLAIDGYNWGSNYSFSHWKSFSEIFSFQYVKMVKQFPDKPIMLAEVASAEPHDQPDPEWGQDGNDSDANESKEDWVADMMLSVQKDYPAINAIVWFNTNKELSWALTLSGNTGLNAYNAAILSPYFSANLDKVTSEEQPEDNKGKYNNFNRFNNFNSFLSRRLERALARKDKAHKKAKHIPQVIGDKFRKEEAEGIKKMSREMLNKWRSSRFTD